MTDTQPGVDAAFTALFADRSGSDRVIMACDMFDSARRLIEADLRSLDPAVGELDLRIQVFRRLYAGDLDPEMIARVIAVVRETSLLRRSAAQAL